MKRALAIVVELFTPTAPRRTTAVFWLALAGFAAAVVGVVDPTSSAWFPPCPLRALTGLSCPGCGSTRALHHLLHGELVATWRLNPLLAAYAPVLGHGLLSTLMLAVTGRPLPSEPLRPGYIWALLVTAIAVAIVRNTVLWPYR